VIEETESDIISFWSFIIEGFAYLGQKNFNLSRENFIKSNDILMKWYPEISSLHKEYFLGLTELKLKKIQNVPKRIEKIKRMLSEHKNPEYVKFILDLLHREFSITEGSVDEDMTVFEKIPFSYIEGQRWVSFLGDVLASDNLLQPKILNAQLYEIKGDIDKAIDVLEKYPDLDSYDDRYREGHLRLTPPKLYYHLGRLYEKKGLKQRAKENYSKFLTLFKDADLGLPEVEDAKERLANLKNN
jgi:tetratricopeptide (TPR) repeat protein